MKTYTLIRLILFLSLVFESSGQDSARSKSVIKTNLVSYLPNLFVNTGCVNLEYEKHFGKNNSYLLDCGFIYSYGPTKKGWLSYSIDQNKTNGFIVNYQIRHYFNRSKVFEPLCLIIWPLVFQLNSEKKTNTGIYVAGKCGYRHTFTEIPLENGSIHINRANPFFMFNVGFQSINKKRLCFDQSFGVGFQFTSSFSGSQESKLLNSPVFTQDNRHIFPMINYSFKIGFEL